MRLGKRDEHTGVIRGPQNLAEVEMRTRRAAIVVRVDTIDAEALKAPHALLHLRIGRRSSSTGVVQRYDVEENAAAIQIKIPAVNPELAEPEAHGKRGIQRFSSGRLQRQIYLIPILRGMDIPEFIGLPFLGNCDASLF